MRYGILATLIVAIVGILPYAQQDKKPEPTSGTTELRPFSLAPICTISLGHNGGKNAIINFCGDKVTYSGDLPIDESAKIFFDVVMHYDQSRCDERVKLVPPAKYKDSQPKAQIEQPKEKSQ